MRIERLHLLLKPHLAVVYSVGMRKPLREKIIRVCREKIASKGPVGVSFHAFFAQKNDDPERLMEAAQWWIMTNKLDHFEEASSIKNLVEAMN